MSNAYRDEVIENVAVMLARSYPGHLWLNAACATVRAMKGTKREEYNGTNAYPDEN